ncbi:trypsin-like peptidase domain-containing protein [Sphingomonas sp. 2R-10]|nr:trypsin-like peptidase domain-containing protein [Sphingomonas sp. 2R-10]
MSGNVDAGPGSISDAMPGRGDIEQHIDTLLPRDWQETPFSRPTIDLFRSTVDQIYDPSVPDDHVLDDFAVEAIVIADGSRPVSFIEDGKMLPPMGNGPFIDLMNRQAATIETIGRSVGRVESDVRIAEPWMDGVFYAGSAFVVGPDLAMTNRHVAEIMIRGGKAGSGPFPLNGLWWLNFAGEHGSSVRRRFAVLEVLWAGSDVVGTGSGLDVLDMALLRLGPAEAGDVLPGALALTLDEPGEGQTVGIVGYPGRPRIVVEKPDDQLACAEEAERALLKVFDNRFGFKRAASGEVDAQPGFDGDVRGWTIRHDVSTLGGNSGSPIFDLGPGRPPRVLALHFGGCTRRTNYGTVFDKLADDLRRYGALPG